MSEEEKTVYVLGAGCSRNYESHSDIPGLKCPLDKDFFKMAAKIIRRDRTFVAYDDLFFSMGRIYHYVNRLEAIDLWDRESFSLESTLTFLDLETIDSINGKAREQLAKLMRITIGEALKGPPCPLHKRLTNLIRENDTVISYNYDMLIDHALLLAGKINENSYLLPFSRVCENDEWRKPTSSLTSVKLIKLHGSLSWLFCNKCSSLFCYLKRKAREDHFTKIIDWCPYCHSADVEYILIPPILHKAYKQPGISRIWDVAREELRSASRIVIIGYSMPQTDFRSELLFRRGRPHNDVPVDIVNPDRRVVDRFRLVLESHWSTPYKDTFNHYTSLRSFLNKAETGILDKSRGEASRRN